MRSHRIISYRFVAATALLALTLVPATAQAGSLLSGYGGPGEGNQAVLGSALIGGSRGSSGGSGSSGSSGSASGSGSETSSSSSSTAGSGEGRGGSSNASRGRGKDGSARAKARSRGASQGGSATGASSTPGSQQQFASFYPAAERVPSGGQGVVLGLTSQDILLIVVAAVVLIAIGFFTRRLDRPAEQADIGG